MDLLLARIRVAGSWEFEEFKIVGRSGAVAEGVQSCGTASKWIERGDNCVMPDGVRLVDFRGDDGLVTMRVYVFRVRSLQPFASTRRL